MMRRAIPKLLVMGPSDGTDSAFPALQESRVSMGFQKLAQEPSALGF